MAMRFRQLKELSKTSVGVYRSSIHRRGLFALKDIEAGDMVIEYAGEVRYKVYLNPGTSSKLSNTQSTTTEWLDNLDL